MNVLIRSGTLLFAVILIVLAFGAASVNGRACIDAECADLYAEPTNTPAYPGDIIPEYPEPTNTPAYPGDIIPEYPEPTNTPAPPGDGNTVFEFED